MSYSKSNRLVLGTVVASVLIHGGIYAAVIQEARGPLKKENEVIEFELARAEPPSPAPEEKPAPEPVKQAEPVIRPQVVRHKAPKPLPPPPPNTEPQPAPTNEPPEAIRIGISLGSTTTGGGFSVGVGNTLYGKADSKAADPASVKSYSAPETRKAPFVPPTRLSVLPRLLHQNKPQYPEEAKKAGIEGQVILMLAIDETGRVTRARVLSGPGYGLEKAAEQTALRFQFAPATVDGEPVSTEIRYVYTFVLE